MVHSACGAGEVGTLLVLGADVQQADSRVRHPQDLLSIDGPHDPILVEVLGLGIHVGPDIDDDDGPLVRGEDRGDPRPPHTRQEHLGVEQSRGHHGPGVARRDDGLDFPGGQQPPAPGNRVVPLLAQSIDRLLLHADGLAGMDDRQAVTRGVVGLRQLSLDPLAITNEHGNQLGLFPHGLDSSRDDRTGSKIASHRVQGYPHVITPTGLIYPEYEFALKRRRDAAAGSISQLRIPRGIRAAALDPIRPLPSLGLGCGLDHRSQSQAYGVVGLSGIHRRERLCDCQAALRRTPGDLDALASKSAFRPCS